MPSLETLVFAPLIIIVAYTIFGMSGFGSTLIAVPLLAHLFDLKFALPTIVLLDCITSVSMGFRLRAHVNRRDLVPLLPFLSAGLALGVFLLVRLPGTLLLIVLGLLTTLYGMIYVRGGAPHLSLPRWSAVPVGLFAGTTSASLGVGGPIYVMYLASRGATPDQIRATTPVIFIFTTVVRIALFAVAGIFTREVLFAAALLLPLSLLALWWGHRLHLNLSRTAAVRVIGGLLALSGISLLVRALA
jgi:uncharacterized membrane protein YfcA